MINEIARDPISMLHQLDDDIRNLEENYARAMNCLVAYRKEKAAWITAILNDDVDTIKKIGIAENYKKQIDGLNNPRFAFDEISHYSPKFIM